MITAIRKGALMSLLAGLFVFTACQDKFTEEDLLNAQQQVGYTVHLVEANGVSDSTALANVVVEVSQGGSTVTGKTDADGFVKFDNIKIGKAIVKVKSANYLNVNYVVNLNTENSKVGQMITKVPMLPVAGKNTAKVFGKVEIESDVTNEKSELVPAGQEIKVTFNAFDEKYIFDSNYNYDYGFVGGEILSMEYEPIVAKVKEDGTYEVTLPADYDGITYNFDLPVITLDQKIALWKYASEADTFYLPRVENVSTIFEPGADTESFYQENIPTVFFKFGGEFIGYTNITSSGTLSTSQSLNKTSMKRPEGTYSVEVVDLTGKGTGATAEITFNSSKNYSGFRVVNSGSGYMDDDKNEFWLNRIYPFSGTNDFQLVLENGAVVRKNIHYGTGSLRYKQLQVYITERAR